MKLYRACLLLATALPAGAMTPSSIAPPEPKVEAPAGNPSVETEPLPRPEPAETERQTKLLGRLRIGSPGLRDIPGVDEEKAVETPESGQESHKPFQPDDWDPCNEGPPPVLEAPIIQEPASIERVAQEISALFEGAKGPKYSDPLSALTPKSAFLRASSAVSARSPSPEADYHQSSLPPKSAFLRFNWKRTLPSPPEQGDRVK